MSIKVDFCDVFHTKMKKSKGRTPSTKKKHLRKKRSSASCPKKSPISVSKSVICFFEIVP